MMKYARKLYHFLGSINFTLVLIAAVAMFVIAGTFIESSTQSHRFAARFTYSNPLFALLLWGFFINILFSAMRRWPFKVKHIPFLITHMGLLMILAGVLAKHYFGLQGAMSITEGSASHDIFKTDSYAVLVSSKGTPSQLYPIKENYDGSFNSTIVDTPEGLHLHLLNFAPHSSERLLTWIKGNYATITGLAPIPVAEDNITEEALPRGKMVRFYEGSPLWELLAIRTADAQDMIEKLYRQNTFLHITDRLTNKVLSARPLNEALKNPFAIEDYGLFTAHLKLNFSPILGFEHPELTLTITKDSQMQQLNIPLDGSQALLNLNATTPFLGSLPYALDIQSNPHLAFIEDNLDDIHLVTIDPCGQLSWQPYRNERLDALFSYDDGYGGYSVQAEPPILAKTSNRTDREAALTFRLERQLTQALKENIALSPPILMWQQACGKSYTDFSKSLLAFLTLWDHTNHWIYPSTQPLPAPLAQVIQAIDWANMTTSDRQGCHLASTLFFQIDPYLQSGEDILTVLHKIQWPLLAPLKALHSSTSQLTHDESAEILTLLTQQVFLAAESLSEAKSQRDLALSTEQKAELFSAFLRAYSIHLSTISPLPSTSEEMDDLLLAYHQSTTNLKELPTPVVLETNVVAAHQPQPPNSKLEDLSPLIKLHVRKGQQAQNITLAYSHNATGLKWPLFDGEYLLRFQPAFESIPYHLRLRNARQITYANSSQPYSFECDLIITDRRTGHNVEKTISMNQVHETWDGYRFYLAAMSPPNEGAVKQVQIIVNHDPAKYWLTYSGALILTCGIVLLFIMRPYRRK